MAMLPVRRSSGRNLTAVNPSREFEDIYDRMGQLMNLAFGLNPLEGALDGADGRPWVPLADISETDNAYMVKLDVPGVQRDQLDIQLQDRDLVITGEIPESEQEGRTHRRSRRTGRFEFRTYLPGDVNADGVNAQLADGVLTVTIPKSEAAKPRHIEISG
jgi:HSP20 family protein